MVANMKCNTTGEVICGSRSTLMVPYRGQHLQNAAMVAQHAPAQPEPRRGATSTDLGPYFKVLVFHLILPTTIYMLPNINSQLAGLYMRVRANELLSPYTSELVPKCVLTTVRAHEGTPAKVYLCTGTLNMSRCFLCTSW